MKLVMIGAGNVATVLGRKLKRAGHEILQVVNHHADNARLLAAELDCAAIDFSGKISPGADMYIVAIKDGALPELHQQLHLGTKTIVHTAGAVSKDVLKDISPNYGVLYPLQSLRKEMQEEVAIPLLLDASNYETMDLLEQCAGSISSRITRASDEERLKLHLAAVVVSNFTNHLYALADEFCLKEKVDFHLLQPLIEETALRVAQHAPADVQTGPAIRHDIVTLEKHLRMLERHKKLKYLYLKLTESIMGR